jgi:hypothetical protein
MQRQPLPDPSKILSADFDVMIRRAREMQPKGKSLADVSGEIMSNLARDLGFGSTDAELAVPVRQPAKCALAERDDGRSGAVSRREWRRSGSRHAPLAGAGRESADLYAFALCPRK